MKCRELTETDDGVPSPPSDAISSDGGSGTFASSGTFKTAPQLAAAQIQSGRALGTGSEGGAGRRAAEEGQ